MVRPMPRFGDDFAPRERFFARNGTSAVPRFPIASVDANVGFAMGTTTGASWAKAVDVINVDTVRKAAKPNEFI